MTTWADSVLGELTNLRDALREAGVPATLNRADLSTPGAWVRPDTGNRATLRGGTCRASVLLVVSQQGDEEALGDLLPLLGKALTVLDPAEDVDMSVILPLRGNNLPAFRLVVDLDLEE